MSKSSPNTDRRVINWPASDAPDFEKWDAYPAAAVRKIVLGPSPGTGDAKPLELDLAKFAERLPQFPNLTHLYLWQIKDLKTLPALPPKLQCLDMRGCSELVELPALPEGLQTLILDGCTSLESMPELTAGKLPNLVELSLKGCGTVPEKWLHHALEAAPGLKHFDASGCSQLSRVLAWPPNLDRIELNECVELSVLPSKMATEVAPVGSPWGHLFDEVTRL